MRHYFLVLLAAVIAIAACEAPTASPTARRSSKKSTATAEDDLEAEGKEKAQEKGEEEEESSEEDDGDDGAKKPTTKADAGAKADASTTPPAPPKPSPGQVAFGPVFESLNPTCGSCHRSGANNAPIFFGATAETTYPLFKTRGFNTGTKLQSKGIHAGPAASATQAGVIQKWIAAE